jgi:hypothetical protein
MGLMIWIGWILNMKSFYIRHTTTGALQPFSMDSQGCLWAAIYGGTSRILSSDVKEWRDKAKHGDAFIVNPENVLWCLDLEIDLMDRLTAGPLKKRRK